MELKVDAEFKALIPALRPDEYEELEASLARDGCLDPLKVWRGTIIDGHHRHEICQAHGIEYDTFEVYLADRAEALLWIETNQLGRRNLTDDQRTVIALSVQRRRSAAVQAAAGSAANEARWHGSVSHTVCETDKPKTDTRAAVAKEAGVSRRKLTYAAEIEKSAPEKLEEIRSGEKTILEVRRETKKAEVEASIAELDVRPADGSYDVIVIDPPWPMEKIERDCRPNQVAFDYPVMTEGELAELAIPCADDCHVFVWTTHKHLPMALRLLECWDARYVCTFVWHKPGGFQPIGLPQYNCEFALYARVGAPKFVDTKALPVCFNAPRGKHSEKPSEFYDTIKRVTAGQRLDMFSRRKIDGFDAWGNEA